MKLGHENTEPAEIAVLRAAEIKRIYDRAFEKGFEAGKNTTLQLLGIDPKEELEKNFGIDLKRGAA